MTIMTTDQVPVGLPRTAEGAANRYLNQYEVNFRGEYDEMRRLRSLAEARIIRLRRKAPTFHEEKLPLLINQACSALLTCDTRRESERVRFNELHMYFLKILDDLTKTQPAGEVSFQKELDRTKARDKLEKQRKALRKRITELEAKEFDADDLGDEDGNMESDYLRTFAELDKFRKDLKVVVHRLAQMEGEDIDDMDPFVLRIPERSSLKKLSQEQLKLLEDQFIEFTKKYKKTRELYMNQSHIEEMIAKLQLDPFRFTKEDLREINKDALEAFKCHFRLQENRKRDEYFQELLDNKELRPKEGDIIENPDDVPEEILERFEESGRQYRRQLANMEDEFIRRQGNEEATQTDDEIEDDDDSDAVDEQLRLELERDSLLYKRIKEEPRDIDDDDLDMDLPPTEDEVEQYPLPITQGEPSNGDNNLNSDAPLTEDDMDQEQLPIEAVVSHSDKIPIIDISDDDDL